MDGPNADNANANANAVVNAIGFSKSTEERYYGLLLGYTGGLERFNNGLTGLGEVPKLGPRGFLRI